MNLIFSKLAFRTFILTALCSLFASVVLAQGPDTPLEVDGDPDVNVPLDGGISVLVAAGVAYGVKKVYDKRKQNKENDLA